MTENKKDFCTTNSSPLILIVIIAGLGVLGWGAYLKNTEIDLILEDSSIIEDAFLPANFATPRNNFTRQVAQNNSFPKGTIESFQTRGSNVINHNDPQFHLQQSYKQAIARVRPSVVSIRAIKLLPNGINDRRERMGGESIGSGIIVSNEGHVLTNYHVIQNANKITVRGFGINQQEYEARVVDHHMSTDLTLLKIVNGGGFDPADLGNSDMVEIGDFVLTFGSPFGLEQTVTSGIVSGKRPKLDINGLAYTNMIQTDAPINQGSSGGPLVNTNGEVIGINTAIYAPTGVSNGTGFAMPINKIKQFLKGNKIFIHGNANQTFIPPPSPGGRGWLGIEVQPVDNTAAVNLGLPFTGGVMVNRVIHNSPAWFSGLERGDVILELNGVKIANINELENTVAGFNAGATVFIMVYSNNMVKEHSLVLSGSR